MPRTATELAELEASYRPFSGAAEWSNLSVDGARWRRFAHVLACRRAAAGARAWSEATERLLRAAALDSSALDGLFPANPQLTGMVLDGSIGDASGGGGAADPVELVAECHRRALVLASEAAADGREVSAHLIAVLQDVITESQASYTVTTESGAAVEVDLPRRQYKPVSNYLPLQGGGLAVFAPASMVAAEMERLSAELNSAAFGALHPAVQAAYAHYALTAIHPFADGNGRLARTVAAIFLIRSAGVPLLVFAEQWPVYYQALERATQSGDYQALVDFVSVTTMSVLDLAANLVARPLPGDLTSDKLAALGEAGPDAGDLDASTAMLDEAACALLETLAAELREALVSPPRGVRIAITASQTAPTTYCETAYRPAHGNPAVVRFAARGPAGAARGPAGAARGPAGAACADLEFVALTSILPGDQLPVALRETRTGELLEVALDDACPLVLEPAELRTRLWVQRLVSAALDRMTPVGITPPGITPPGITPPGITPVGPPR